MTAKVKYPISANKDTLLYIQVLSIELNINWIWNIPLIEQYWCQVRKKRITAEVQWWGLTACIKHFWTPSQKAEAALPTQPEPLAETAPPAVHVNVGAPSAKDLPVTLTQGDFSPEAGSLFPPAPELAQPPSPDPNQSGQPGSESKVPR